MSPTTKPLQIRLLAAVIGVTAVFFTVLGWVSVDRISVLTTESVHTEALDLVALRGQEIEGFFKERGRVVETMLRAPSLHDFFGDYNSFRRPLQGDRGYKQVRRLFQTVVASDETIASAFLSTDSTGEYFRESGRVERAGYDPKARWWWAEALQEDKLYVSPPGLDAGTGEIAVTIQTTVYHEDGRFLGVGGTDVLLGSLGSLIEDITLDGVGDAFLVNKIGQIIYFPDIKPDEQDLEKASAELADIDSLSVGNSGFGALAERLRESEAGLSRVRWNGVEVIVVHTPVSSSSPDFEWTLGLMVPEETITSVITHARWTTALAVLIAIGAIALATFVVTQRINSHLREEDRRKADILAEANLSLIEADRMKSRFLATMSHELRTPLNSIIGFAQVLEKRLDGQIDKVLVKFLRNIHNSGQHLLTVLSDILDLSKVEAGKMELEPEFVDVEEAISGVCTVIQGMARERRIMIETDVQEGLPRIEADLVRVKQILYNLLSNAVKYSDDGGTVTVVARELAIDDNPLGSPCVEMTVIDRGLGINAEDQDIIFEEFRQAENSDSKRVGGTGLGLALVKNLVELHHGMVELTSEPGEGSAFRVVLPRRFQCADSTGVFYATPAVPSRAGRRVLIVEDDTEAYETMSRSLAGAGFIPERSSTGEDALERALQLDPVAIVLDIILPKNDGWEILRELKKREETRHIPVIMVSVLANHELGLALGADAYFTKPIDRGRLVERLGELTRNLEGDQLRALVIDDDSSVHELLEEILAPAGFTVENSLSGADGLRIARSTPPDIIVLDLMMDEMDGYEVARELKLDPRTRGVPIVVFTALHPSLAEREQLRGKIEALVHKAANPGSPDLLPVLNDVLTR